ncbi:hypothetical protein [Deinococcus hopiensis]|uniref:Uncharacterized protein n=1 Tax=Deinococcus hopiensis KR-140 TaxID=695939 RepID=A0A1W1V053_9DEIO|nr:hypothetical protein [Deinococcus hopiensis]SMB86391.1 hypothetical protein SAMN00790413_03793 [Deinococcus hopiensis KR-140]
MNEANTALAARLPLEGPLWVVLQEALKLLPGAPVQIQVNAIGWDLMKPVRLLAGGWPTDSLELGGFADGEEDVHPGFVTTDGLGEQLREECAQRAFAER